jgi:hypothetical protein
MGEPVGSGRLSAFESDSAYRAMRDLLIRYLLGELNEVEQSHLEERLRQSPELRRELDYLRSCFAPSDNAVQPDAGGPPSGLAQRTTEQVTHLSDDSPSDDSFDPLARQGAVEPPVGSMSWSLADLSVAAGVFLAVSMLLLPALRGSRDTSRRNQCAKNQSELGRAIFSFAGDNGMEYPRVEMNDKAGIFAAWLADGDYFESEYMKKLLLCPASSQRDAHAAGKIVIEIPSVQQLRTARGAELDRLLRNMLFSYAYRIGYFENNQYH